MEFDNWSAVFGSGFFRPWVLFILSVIVGTGIQEAIRSAVPYRPRPGGELPPSEVAFLSGGAERALLSAVTALKVAELVVVADGTVQAIGRPGRPRDPLQQAVLAATTGAVPCAELADRPVVADALAAIEIRLIEEGLLLSGRRRRLIRLLGFLLLAVAATVLVRSVLIVVETRSLVTGILGLVAVAVAVRFLRRSPRRSRRGERVLGEARRPGHAAGVRRRPSWPDRDAAGAALIAGLYGHEAVRGCDPGLADALCLPQVDDGGSRHGMPQTGDGGGVFGSGDSWGSGGGWDSGGGWNSGGGWDSGSSSGDSGSSWSSGGGSSGGDSGSSS